MSIKQHVMSRSWNAVALLQVASGYIVHVFVVVVEIHSISSLLVKWGFYKTLVVSKK